MTILLVVAIAVFVYLVLNWGERPGRDGAPPGWNPVITALIVALIAWLVWPVIGPAAAWLVVPITAAYK